MRGIWALVALSVIIVFVVFFLFIKLLFVLPIAGILMIIGLVFGVSRFRWRIFNIFRRKKGSKRGIKVKYRIR